MWFVVLLIMALFGFQGLAVLVSREQLSHIDEAIIHIIQGRENSVLTSAAKIFSVIGSAAVVVPLVLASAALLAIILKHRKELLLLLGGVAGSTLLNSVLKGMYQRARPDINRIVEEQGYSFPSGHSMAAFTLYFLLTYLLWRHLPTRGARTALIAFSAGMILCIGLSRIYLGVHYPSDIVAGFWISGCWVAICIRLFRQYGRAGK
ncbi:phosphatase PAP2 family protein [Paenibacillus oenotherae]|uniref:Phosphatase PAP2 family protein n=1 Tax=Paenibacillus oenotherae TaxID=1435645 RepID=A0ABS7DAD8_9BACL|nr:phosphatase PAP2 family protein [Paenibacillus oenotherae]MBW7476902.1 phosphatase PAP2 family protein [Paenibacillus oenotherae]